MAGQDSPGELYQCSDRLRHLAEELDGCARHLRTRVESADWEGAAATAFRSRMRARVRAAEAGARRLRSAGAALEACARRAETARWDPGHRAGTETGRGTEQPAGGCGAHAGPGCAPPGRGGALGARRAAPAAFPGVVVR